MSKILLVFLLSYVVGLGLSITAGAHWAFYVYELVYFLNPEKRWWAASFPFSKFSLLSVGLLLFATILFYGRSRYGENHLSRIPATKWVVSLALVYALTYFAAVDPGLHSTAAIEFVKLFAIIAIGYKVLDNRRKLDFAFYTMVVGVAYLGFLAYSMGRDEYGRIGRIGMIDAPDVNVAAAAMIAVLPFLILYFWRGNLRTRIVMTILGGVIVNGLVLANSRGAFLGGIAGCAYFVWEMFRSRFNARMQRFTAVCLVFLGIVAALSVIDSLFIERMLTLTEVEDENKSGSNRVKFWMITFDVLKAHPWGVGAFGYEILSPQYVPAEYFDFGKKQKAVHSVWFQALGEAGYFGFLCFAMLILNSIRQLYRARRYCYEKRDIDGYYFVHAILAAFLGVLIASSFINNFRTQIIWWFVMFSACAYNIVVVRGASLGVSNDIQQLPKGASKFTAYQRRSPTH